MLSLHLRSFLRLVRNAWEIYCLQVIALAVAFAAFVVVFSFVFSEFTVSHHFGDNNLVRILQKNESKEFEGRNRLNDKIPQKIIDQLRDMNVTLARTKTLNDLNVFSERRSARSMRVHAVDQSFLDLFYFDFIGDQRELKPGTVALSERTSVNLFGTSKSIGQKLTVGNNENSLTFTVAVVFADPPHNSHDQFEVLIPLASNLQHLNFDEKIFNAWAQVPYRKFEGDLTLLKAEDPNTPWLSYRAQPVRDIYFGPRVIGESARHGDFYCVFILSCIVTLIMVLAVTNFINLTSLTLPARSKELAMRKVAGAGRPTLLGLMAKESLIVVTMSLIGAALMVIALHQPAKEIFFIDMLAWIDGNSTAAYIVIGLLVASVIAAPLIPAWTFVKASPGRLLGTNVITFPFMKKVITVVQLGVSISLIIVSLVINRQISRSLIKEPGRNHDQVVYIPFPDGMSMEYFNRLKNDWPRDNPNIVDLTAVSHTPDIITSLDLAPDITG